MDVANSRTETTGSRPDAMTREITARLLDRARAEGTLPRLAARQTDGFSAGNTAHFVGVVSAGAEIVVKVDDSPGALREALFLRDAKRDVRLPEALRQALPAVYAIEGDGPPYGYLMEYLAGYRRAAEYVLDPELRRALPQVVEAVWEILGEAYAVTRTTQVAPRVDGEYIGMVNRRLALAGRVEPLIVTERPIRVRAGDEVVELPPWREITAKAERVALRLRPDFATFIHGALHLDNVLVSPVATGMDIKLIDLSDREQGDWAYDVAMMVRGLLVTSLVGDGLPRGLPRIIDGGDAIELAYERSVPAEVSAAEQRLLMLAGAFADAHGDTDWVARSALAGAVKMLRSVPLLLAGRLPQRAMPESPNGVGQYHLGVVMLAEGLRRMWHTVEATH
jgi:hypothetical protein